MLYKLKLFYLSIIITSTYPLCAFPQLWDVSKGFELTDQQIGAYSDLYDYTEILYDSTGSWSYDDIIKRQTHFKKNKTQQGFKKDGIYWIKSIIKGSSSTDGRYLFSIGLNRSTWPVVGFAMATWPFIDIYVQENDSVRLIRSGFKNGSP